MLYIEESEVQKFMKAWLIRGSNHFENAQYQFAQHRVNSVLE